MTELNKGQRELIYNYAIELDGSYAPQEVVEGDSKVGFFLKGLLKDELKASKYYGITLHMFNEVCFLVTNDINPSLSDMLEAFKALVLLVDDNENLKIWIESFISSFEDFCKKMDLIEEFF